MALGDDAETAETREVVPVVASGALTSLVIAIFQAAIALDSASFSLYDC